MCVRSPDIGSPRDDCTSVTETLLVGDIVNGQGILVVTVTDVTAVVLLVWATVDDALSIVCVAILASTALHVWLGGIFHVDEHWSTLTGVIATGSTTGAVSNCVSELFVGNNGVCSALDTLVDVDKGNVFLDVESLGVLGRKLEDLLQVEDLDMVANTFRSNNEAVANHFDLTPDDGVVVGWKTTEVLQFTLLRDLREGGTVGLTDGNLGKS
jgi:hypothetical protein